MYSSRREFLRSAGILLSAMVLARVPSLTGFGTIHLDSPRQRVRRAWLLKIQPGVHTGSTTAEGQMQPQELLSQHQFALDELVAARALEVDAAHQVQSAFQAAILYNRRSGTLISHRSRREPVPYPTYEAAAQLVRHTRILAGLAAGGKFSPETAAEAQRVISRAMAIITTPQEGSYRLYNPLDRSLSGRRPAFEELSLQVSPASQAAARFLGDLLSMG